ncbi:MAG: GH3 auxin-responsive promoter family protein [Clostridia bacterium]|nr:GH3 auxin-responsive promoter family protein [Clostridia bacterium]MBR0537087.1 GH3 auxin-responsive promoter family protein [Clostridia bacterium]
MGIDKLLLKADVLGGKIVYKGFERITSQTEATQKKLLQKLMRKNANTEYGKKYGFADVKTPEDYRNKVPDSTYADYAEYIQRMIKGESNLITSAKIRRYVETSGSAGVPKVVPISAKASWNVYCMGFISPAYCVYKYLREQGRKMYYSHGMMSWIIMEHKFPNGEKVCDGASIPISKLRAILPFYSVVPREIIFNEHPQDIDSYYLILRFALPHPDVSFIGAIVLPSTVSIFQYLETNWETLCDDIEKGVINDSVVLPPDMRKKLEKKLKPDPARAALLRKEFAKGFEDPICPRIWPTLSWAYGMAGGTLADYAMRIRRYVGENVPVHKFGYGASEGYFAMLLEPEADEAVMLPRSNYFEFIPRDPEEGETPRMMHEVQVGKEYEVLLTNLSGFYRYHLGDVVKVTGFHNNAPIVKFMYRTNVMVNVCDEKTTQLMLDNTMEAFRAQTGIAYQSYSVCGETQADVPHYTVLIETDGKTEISEELRAEAARVFDEKMRENNVEYNRYRANSTLSPAEAHFISPGAFDEYRKDLQNKGRDTNQLKPVTILNSPEKKEFFFSRIVL